MAVIPQEGTIIAGTIIYVGISCAPKDSIREPVAPSK